MEAFLMDLLACPACHATLEWVRGDEEYLRCTGCTDTYGFTAGLPVFTRRREA